MNTTIGVTAYAQNLAAARRRIGAARTTERFASVFVAAIDPARRERFDSLTAFIGDAQYGLGITTSEFKEILADGSEVIADMDPSDPRQVAWTVALTELRAELSTEEPVRGVGPGRPVSSNRVNAGANAQVNHNPRTARITHDDSAGAIMARLRRDDPATADRVARGESTAHFEAVKRGWRKPSITLGEPATVAARLRERYSRAELGLLIGALLAGDDAPGLADLWTGGDENRLAGWARDQSIPWSAIADAAGLTDAHAARYRYSRR